MKTKINKFIVTHDKCEQILLLGYRYLKFYEANFTNKTIKENSLNIIPMKIEKENNFIDIGYLQNQDISVIITDSNNIFIYEKGALKY